MEHLRIFTVYDSKAEAYLQPFFMQSKGQAIRAFGELSNDPQHQFYKHAADFTLFEIGTYDTLTGKVNPHSINLSLGCAVEFKKQYEGVKNEVGNVTQLQPSSQG